METVTTAVSTDVMKPLQGPVHSEAGLTSPKTPHKPRRKNGHWPHFTGEDIEAWRGHPADCALEPRADW